MQSPILQGKVKSVYDVPGEADKVTIPVSYTHLTLPTILLV